MKRVVVTGAGGFLGRYLVAELLTRGWDTVAVTRRVAATDRAGDKARVVAMELPSRDWDDLVAKEQPDALVHLAGPTSVQASVERPYPDFHECVGMLYECVDAVRRLSPGTRVLYFSSAAVYGNPATLPVREDAPTAPVSPYGLHRVLGENILAGFHHIYGMRTASMRIFSAYGAGLPRQVVWDICRQALQDDAVRLFGTGEETRDFIHASDVARAAALLLEKAPFTRDVYNVASGFEVTIRGLAERVLQGLSVDKPILFSGEPRRGDPQRWRADVSRLSALGFTPRVDLAEGLEQFTSWARNQLA